jgi:hypothetical protein
LPIIRAFSNIPVVVVDLFWGMLHRQILCRCYQIELDGGKMSEILTAMRTAALLLTPLVIFMIVVSAVAVKRGEENVHGGDH